MGRPALLERGEQWNKRDARRAVRRQPNGFDLSCAYLSHSIPHIVSPAGQAPPRRAVVRRRVERLLQVESSTDIAGVFDVATR